MIRTLFHFINNKISILLKKRCDNIVSSFVMSLHQNFLDAVCKTNVEGRSVEKVYWREIDDTEKNTGLIILICVINLKLKVVCFFLQM